SGEEAASFLIGANTENPPAPDGQAYVCARITAQNTSDRTESLQMVDFAGTGGDGILRRTQAVVVPEPMLQAVVEPGATTEGWIAVTVDDPSVATLWFDAPILGGSWADGIFALADGAPAPVFEPLDATDTDIGGDPANPAAIGETVRVGGWEVTIDEVIFGEAIFEIADFRYRALGSTNSWIQRGIGLYATVRNMNPFPAFFSDIAFEIADFSGEPWDHTLTMTPPEPDVSQEYLPGATGQGWATFGGQTWTAAELIKVQPFKIGGAARYVIFDGNQPVADAPAEEAEPAVALDLAVGDLVETTEDLVNLRDEPSANAGIAEELPVGTQLEVTGESTDADGYTWYPVIVLETSRAGYVVQDFLQPVGN
nr:SH3 domain-containing protein [Chloroflexia bacterium]